MEARNYAKRSAAAGRGDVDGAVWALMTLLTEYTLDLDMRSVRRLSATPGLLPPGSRIGIKPTRGCPLEQVVTVSEKLVGNGFRPVVGLPAEWLAGDRQTERVLRTLTAAGVRDIQLSRPASGDLEAALSSALRLFVASPAFRESCDSAGLPVTFETALEAESAQVLGLYQALGAMATEHAIEIYHLADVCDSAHSILDLERRLRRTGSRLGLRATLATRRPRFAGLLTALDLGRHTVPSQGVPRSRRPASRPSTAALLCVLIDLADAMEADPDCLLDRVHLIPERDLVATVEWAEAVDDGRFYIEDTGRRREVVLCARQGRDS